MDNGSLRPIHVELRSLSHRIHRFFQNSPNKRAVDSVTGTNGWIIGYLADHEGRDVFQKDIEKEFDITRSTASKVIDLMEQKGLVERQTVPHDARLRKLVLTEKSRQLVNLICIDKENLEKTLTKGFSDEEKATLTEYILRMRNNLEEEGGK
ncbi:MAG: MarR family winged helix-turn-helix transcriptional regulator [Clostridia bacterium]|nr:MarR family winged helix-turn-helix transcriptional regulator [Clostridia bacterium]